METKNTLMTKETEEFLLRFHGSFLEANNLKSNNDKTISSALIYEKLRVAVEYQEEHLILKNAIARIVRRKYTLTPNITANRMFSDLISELAWSNYINPELITDQYTQKITKIIEKYLIVLKNTKTARFNRRELNHMIVDWLACELDEVLHPDPTQQLIVDYAYSVLSKNLDLQQIHLTSEENEIQLKAAIYGFILKPDYAQIQYWFLKNIYPSWATLTNEHAEAVAHSFDPFYNKLDHAFNHPYRKNYIQFTKKLIPPFVLIYSVLQKKKIDPAKIKEKPAILHDMVMEEYNRKVAEARHKVWRGTIRALIFILITKISLALIIEIPFDKYFQGSIDYLSLIINISLPPVLMFVAGTFVKSPPKNNYKIISESVNSLMAENQLDTKTYPLIKTQSSTFQIFNFFYTIISLFILAGVIWLLLFLNFNFVSIILFFFFVSVVSFFSFRIRSMALELAMKQGREDALTSIFELIMMPFIRIGKFFSDQFMAFNPMILILDFLIEAPLKTLIRIFNSWRRFFNAKKEELEL